MNSGRCGKCGKWGAVAFFNNFGVIMCQSCLERHLIEARGERLYDDTPMPKKTYPRTVTARVAGREINITLDGQVRPGMRVCIDGYAYVVTEPEEWVIHTPMLEGFGGL